MVFKKWLSRKKNTGLDPLRDLTLAGLKVGYYLDYDLKTWTVTGAHYYDWGDGDVTYEWQLKSHDDTIYLEREPGDEEYWSISRKIAIQRLDEKIIQHVKQHEEPPERIRFEETTYFLEETAAGHFFQSKEATGRELIRWDFINDGGEKILSIEQWDEDEFEAAVGIMVQDWQFTNILPGEAAAGR